MEEKQRTNFQFWHQPKHRTEGIYRKYEKIQGKYLACCQLHVLCYLFVIVSVTLHSWIFTYGLSSSSDLEHRV